MTVKEQIKALKEHNLKITIDLCDGVAAYEKENGDVFLVIWIVDDTPKTSYYPGWIEVDFGGVTYSRVLNEDWSDLPRTLYAAFERSDLCNILLADTSEWGDGLYMAVFGLDYKTTDVYNLEWNECLYDLDKCKRPSLKPIYDFITVKY